MGLVLGFLNKIPTHVWFLIAFALVYAYGFYTGADSANKRFKQKEDAMLVESLKSEIKFKDDINELNTRLTESYAKRNIVIREATKNNENLALTTHDSSIASTGFVQLHDKAAKSELADPTASLDGTPSGVAYNQVLSTVSANYGSCNEYREQLIGLQNWILEYNQKLSKKDKNK